MAAPNPAAEIRSYVWIWLLGTIILKYFDLLEIRYLLIGGVTLILLALLCAIEAINARVSIAELSIEDRIRGE